MTVDSIPKNRAEIVDALRRNPVAPTGRLFWTVQDEYRFRAMVAAGDYNRVHPISAIRPSEVQP